MKNKNGFTLVELLAVIVILAIILTIATTSVIKNINDSKAKAKYIAAKEIVDIAEAYIETEGFSENTEYANCVLVEDMVNKGYLEDDVTNPLNGENRSNSNLLENQRVCKNSSNSSNSSNSQQEGYEPSNNKYMFDGYYYMLRE